MRFIPIGRTFWCRTLCGGVGIFPVMNLSRGREKHAVPHYLLAFARIGYSFTYETVDTHGGLRGICGRERTVALQYGKIIASAHVGCFDPTLASRAGVRRMRKPRRARTFPVAVWLDGCTMMPFRRLWMLDLGGYALKAYRM
jgi:hypothetical protein